MKYCVDLHYQTYGGDAGHARCEVAGLQGEAAAIDEARRRAENDRRRRIAKIYAVDVTEIAS